MLGHYTCYACGDSWCRDLIDLEVQAYIEQHPELADRIVSRDINSVDLGSVLCDGCEDEYYQEETSLDEAWDAHYGCIDGIPCGEPDCKICHERKMIRHELYTNITPKRICSECQNVFELNKINPLGDILFCEGVGVYFTCDKCFVLEGYNADDQALDLEDEIDRKADLMKHGRL